MFLEERLEERRVSGLLRTLSRRNGGIDFASNDYFGFAREWHEGGEAGSTGSRLLTGNSIFCEELEERIAKFHRAESCLIYTSGYLANQGLLSAIGTSRATFLYDLEVHASMVDGMRLSDAKCVPFRHNDLSSLEARLKKASPPVFILVESLYSISGDLAPLAEIGELAHKWDARLIVDEAHAGGVGYAAGLNVFARMHTFGQALGTQGACVLGSRLLRDYLINFSRPFIYTTALSPAALCQIARSYDRLEAEGEGHRQKLHALIAAFCEKTGRGPTGGPIQPIYTKHSTELSERLWERGIDVRAIRPPTVAKKKECLRVVLHSFNQPDELDQLLEALS